MTKNDITAFVANKCNLSKADAECATDAVLEAIKSGLKSGDTVTIVGFGSFVVRSRAARTGRNPRTGETLEIKASKVPAFKPGKALKDAVS